MMKNRITLSLLCLAGVAFGQGSLTPPGAPGATMKTLDQLNTSILDVSNAIEAVEARIDLATVPAAAGFHHGISTPGSYYLSENLTIDETSGIYISASDVTIDLNGFEINRGSGDGGFGVYAQSGFSNIRIMNGTIRRCATGILSAASQSALEDLVVSDCSTVGIQTTTAAVIQRCRVLNCSGKGIIAGPGSSVQSCWVDAAGSYGIEVATESSVADCVVRNSGNRGIEGSYDCSFTRCVVSGSGLSGFSLSTDSSVVGCVSKDNTSTGFGIGGGSSMSRCTSTGNGGMGIYSTGDGVSLTGCSVRNNANSGIFLQQDSSAKNCIATGNAGQYGIFSNTRSSIIGCSASYNTSSFSSSYGIRAGENSAVQECVAWGNESTHSPKSQSTGAGIYAGAGSLVKDCSAVQNKGAGIFVTQSCQVTGNQCDYNGLYADGTGAGIYVTSGANRITENLLTDNDLGVLVSGSTNLVINNAAGGNTTEFSLTGTQIQGSTVTNSGTISSTDSLANFDF